MKFKVMVSMIGYALFQADCILLEGQNVPG